MAHIFYAQDLFGREGINTAFFGTLCLEIPFNLVYALLVATGRAGIALPLGGAIRLPWPLGIGSSLHLGLFSTSLTRLLTGRCRLLGLT